MAPFLAIAGWYDAARFGSPLDTGYGGQPFSHPFVQGLYGLMLSPGRGVFIYTPILILAVAVFPKLRGPDRVIASFAFVMLLARAVVYARWWSWWAGDVWGPRFLVPALPAFAPAIAAALERWSRSIWIAVVTILAVWMSFLGVWMTTHPDRNPYLAPPLDFGTAQQVIRQGTSRAWTFPRPTTSCSTGRSSRGERSAMNPSPHVASGRLPRCHWNVTNVHGEGTKFWSTSRTTRSSRSS